MAGQSLGSRGFTVFRVIDVGSGVDDHPFVTLDGLWAPVLVVVTRVLMSCPRGSVLGLFCAWLEGTCMIRRCPLLVVCVAFMSLWCVLTV